jgi:hypothetical protein
MASGVDSDVEVGLSDGHVGSDEGIACSVIGSDEDIACSCSVVGGD